jgi:hypothetical protein
MFININRQYKADLTKNPLKNIENAVGDSTCTLNNQKCKGAKGIFIANPLSIIVNNI